MLGISTESAMKIISMVEVCAIWAVIFVVVFYLTRRAGVSAKPLKEAKKRLAAFDKYNDFCIEKMTDDKPDSLMSSLWVFQKHRSRLRVVTRIFAGYEYEHPYRDDCQNLTSKIKEIVNESQQIFMLISAEQNSNAGNHVKKTSEHPEVVAHLRKISELVEEADGLLDEVIEKDNEEKLLNA